MMKSHLPVMGVGPLIVIPQAVLTIASLILCYYGLIPVFRLDESIVAMFVFGLVLIRWGILLWIYAINSNIVEGIKDNLLVVDGAYDLVRNPIYSAFWLIFTGLIIAFSNLLLLIVPIINYIYMSVYIIKTEEKWLYKMHGNEYKLYCDSVRRIIPKIKKIKF